ncbi:LysR substrate-binding domain-containing protein [Streptomyces solincola]|uniref:LysR substrate-binding domain-containing protein n=1 Tax=Streptomyces solincola TaxID=2100817 RepID=UPI00268E1F85|nr:LysR substrate-binding domain-containing protein [Streptomyces solincola]
MGLLGELSRASGRGPFRRRRPAAGGGPQDHGEAADADYLIRLVGAGPGVALPPPTYVAELTGVAVIEVTDAPARAEYVICADRSTRTPAATAFLELLVIDEE